MLTGTTNDLFLQKPSKPFYRWPLISDYFSSPSCYQSSAAWIEQRRHGIQSRFCRGYRGSQSIHGKEKCFPIVRGEEYLPFVLFLEGRFVDRSLKECKWHRITRVLIWNKRGVFSVNIQQEICSLWDSTTTHIENHSLVLSETFSL